MFERAFVVSSCLSLSCFSPTSTFSLSLSTCSLSGTPPPMSITPRDKTAVLSHYEEYCFMAIHHPLTVAGHHRSAYRELWVSHCIIACSSCRPFPVPSCPDLCWSSGAWPRKPSTTSFMRVPPSHGQRAGQSDTLGHGTRALESLGRGSGVTCVKEYPPTCRRLLPRPGRRFTRWIEMGTMNTGSAAHMHVQKIITSRVRG